jgi:hypothetical protein
VKREVENPGVIRIHGQRFSIGKLGASVIVMWRRQKENRADDQEKGCRDAERDKSRPVWSRSSSPAFCSLVERNWIRLACSRCSFQEPLPFSED